MSVPDPHRNRLAEGVDRDTYRGRAPIHVNVQNVPPEVHNSKDLIGGYQGIPVNMTGIATVLARGGYKCHAVGKWDVGMATAAHHPRHITRRSCELICAVIAVQRATIRGSGIGTTQMITGSSLKGNVDCVK